jgi:hypothetical protein
MKNTVKYLVCCGANPTHPGKEENPYYTKEKYPKFD